jgi:hypothetical protein
MDRFVAQFPLLVVLRVPGGLPLLLLDHPDVSIDCLKKVVLSLFTTVLVNVTG